MAPETSRRLLNAQTIWETENGHRQSGLDLFKAGLERGAWHKALLKVFDRFDFLLLPPRRYFPSRWRPVGRPRSLAARWTARLDLAECLQFAGEGKVKVHYSTERLEDINSIFGRMRDNKIDGRVVMKI